jgi:aconitate hydratase
MTSQSFVDLAALKRLYASFPQKLESLRRRLNRPLPLTEKILLTHLADPDTQALERGISHLLLNPDRVAMQDATAQMALLQFMLTGRKEAAVPTTVHCDHLIRAYTGAAADTHVANQENREVYDFLRTCAMKYGIGFWKPGAGIIHQVLLENYAVPGTLMIGTDSHTPNAGGLGMLAVGIGGADAVDVMAGMPWELKYPKVIGVRLTGKFSGWTSAKDVILKICEILTTQGGTGYILEYLGPGTESISCTGKATITNMGAELGATTSVFPYDSRMDKYLRHTQRQGVADLAARYRTFLRADPEVEQNPDRYYDRVIEIDLDTLEPYVVGPHSPDVARPISKLAAEAKEKGYPTQIRVSLIGSCTNSSYEDIGRATHIAKQAMDLGVKAKSVFMVTPGSDQIFATIQRDGYLAPLEGIGGRVLANACGPCIGQWKRDDIHTGDPNTIFTSYNRNFPKRNDGNANTLAFIGSPEIATAMALAGTLEFNPLKDSLKTESGKPLKLQPPSAPELPEQGFASPMEGFIAPSPEHQSIEVAIKPGSDRLQKLDPFPRWTGNDLENLVVLVKAKGKCTTDHISPAGPWLKYRGHLQNISDNLLSGALNAFTQQVDKAIHAVTGATGLSFAELAKTYKSTHQAWVIVGDENYGEGSSREHAAMEPRFLGCLAVIVRSFARIHETNLKKQGILALTFLNPKDYEAIEARDRLSIRGLKQFEPGKPLILHVTHGDGRQEHMRLNHSYNPEQIRWFQAGSALNLIREQMH